MPPTVHTDSAFQRFLVLSAILASLFAAAMDTMLVSTLMPVIVSSIKGVHLYPWVSSASLVGSLMAVPIWGRLSDHYGARRSGSIALVLFILGSLISATASQMAQLILGRTIQGAGSSGIMALAYIVVGLIYPVGKRARKHGVVNSVWAIASIIAPVLGAFFATKLSWRYAFYLNVPIGVLGLVLLRFLKEEQKKVDGFVDYLGAALFGSGAFCLMQGMFHVAKGEASKMDGFFFLAAFFLLLVFYLRMRRSKYPLIPFHLFKNKFLLASSFLTLTATALLYIIVNLLAIFVQGVLGLSAFETGRVIMSVSIGWFFGSYLSGYQLGIGGFRQITVAAIFSLFLGFTGLSFLSTSSRLVELIIPALILGGAMGTLINSNIVAVQTLAAPKELGAATTAVSVFRSFGGAFGVTLAGGIQLGVFRQGLRDLNLDILPERIFRGDIEDPLIKEEVARLLAASEHGVFVFAAVFSLLLLFIVPIIPSKTPQEVL